MKLQDKIYCCRKKAGLSQDALAEKLDVSRQAISKWENGEAIPETAKLPVLAKVFGVSIDWLLSEEEPAEEEIRNTPDPVPEEKTVPEEVSGAWLDNLPGVLGKLARRFGWLAGAYVAMGGAGIAGIGVLTKVLVTGMVNSYTGSVESMTMGMFPSSEVQILDEYGNAMDGEMADMVLEAIGGTPQPALPFGGMMDAQTQILENNPVYFLANVLIVLGVLGLIGGIILAVWLLKWGKREN